MFIEGRDLNGYGRFSRRDLIKAGLIGALGVAGCHTIPFLTASVLAANSSFQFDSSKPPLSCSELALSNNSVVQPLTEIYPRFRFICFPEQDISQVTNGIYTVNGNNWDLDTNIQLLMQSEKDFWGYFLSVQYIQDTHFFPATNERVVMMDYPISYYQNGYPTNFNQEVMSKLNFSSTLNSNGYDMYHCFVLPDNTGTPPAYYYQCQSGAYLQVVNSVNRFVGFSCLSGQVIDYMVNSFSQNAYLTFNYETSHLLGYPDGHTANGVPINEIYNYDTLYNGQLKYLDRFNGNCLSSSITPTPTQSLLHKVYLPYINK